MLVWLAYREVQLMNLQHKTWTKGLVVLKRVTPNPVGEMSNKLDPLHVHQSMSLKTSKLIKGIMNTKYLLHTHTHHWL